MTRLFPWLAVLVGVGALVGPTVAQAHSGHTMQEPWHVCESSTLGDGCEWTNDAGDLYRGTCRQVSNSLLCVRNKPIKYGHTEHDHASEEHPHAHDDHGHSHAAAASEPAPVPAPPRDPEPESSPWVLGGLGLLGLGLLFFWGRSRERRASSTLVAALAILAGVGTSGCRSLEDLPPRREDPRRRHMTYVAEHIAETLLSP